MLLTETLVRTRKSFYKLKNKHVMKSCLWNWNATNFFGSFGIEQICGHFKKLMTILVWWIVLSFNK
jgi:hypothetical protein